MRSGFRPFYQSIPEIYLVLSMVFALVWVASFLIPLPVELNPDGVLRVLVVMAVTVLMSIWGLFGLVLSWLRMPVFELGTLLLVCPVFGFGVWGAELQMVISGVAAYCVIFMFVWTMSALRVFRPIE